VYGSKDAEPEVPVRRREGLEIGGRGEGVRALAAGGGLRLELTESAPFPISWDGEGWLGALGARVLHAGRIFAGPSGGEEAPSGAERLEPEIVELRGEDDLGPYRGAEVGWHPLPIALATTVRAYSELPLLVFRIEAAEDLSGLATGELSEPSVSWPWVRPQSRADPRPSAGGGAFGYQFTEFAFPTWSDESAESFFLLAHRPPIVEPLWIVRGERCVMLCPLDGFHEQVVAVPERLGSGRGVRCGWHGDLDAVPRGFATELALLAGRGPRRLLEELGRLLLRRHGTRRLSRYADETLARLSYWTDNGAAYWYRREPGASVPETLERVASSLREREVPVGAFELDSWFYPHERTRPVGDEQPAEVPPTGMLAWEPRADILPGGIADLRRRLGSPPLVLHSRHFSSRSPYFERHEAWVDGPQAHPSGPELLDRLLAQASSWGAVTLEQDWLVESFLGARGLRERPGRARAWQEGLDRAAADHGLTLLWCMASPADFLQTVTLSRVGSIRTSGDYRYKAGPGLLWTWFLLTNALARALGLHAFKDVFLSSKDGAGWDGDPHAEAEALLATLGAGPVGIGDRAGRTDRELVMRTCRPDGVLVKPDLPIAALERCFAASPLATGELVGETCSEHPAGRWIYLASFHVGARPEPLRFPVELAELGAERPEGPVVAYDWRRGAFERLEPDGSVDLSLGPLDWDLRILCPVLPGELALFGDIAKYATVGDRRIRGIRMSGSGLEFEVLGAPGERIAIHGWSGRGVERVELWSTDSRGWRPVARAGPEAGEGWARDSRDGRTVLRVALGRSGCAAVRIAPER
jgi:hypothetical protein